MLEPIKRLNELKGISDTLPPSIQENIRREAELRSADYDFISRETRPWVKACLDVEDCRRLLEKYGKKQNPVDEGGS